MWWDLPRLLPLYMQVHFGSFWTLYTSPGWEILLHERHQCLPRKRRDVENPCTFLVGKIFQAALKVIKRWWKIKGNGMHFKIKLCPQKWLIFTDMNLRKFLLSHQIDVFLGDTHEQLDKKIVPPSSSQGPCLILNTSDWRETEWSTAEPFYAKLQPSPFSDFQSQTRIPFICHSGYTALVMNPNP